MLLLVFIHRPHILKRLSGRQRLRSSVCYRTPSLQPSTKLQMSTTLHYTITVCWSCTALSQHCLPAIVEARELNLKYARATGKLNPGPFAPAAECVTTRPPRRQYIQYIYIYRQIYIYIYIVSYAPLLSTRLDSLVFYSAHLLQLASLTA